MGDYKEGQTATNPKTGQTVVYRGGQWVSAGALTPVAPKLSAAESKALTLKNAKIAAAKRVRGRIGPLKKMYDDNFKGAGPGSLLEYLPRPANQRFDTAGEYLSVLLKGIIRDPGEGAWTDADQAKLDRLVPNSWKPDASNEQALSELDSLTTDYLGPEPQPAPARKATVKRIR